jgi:hypothetical protein
MMALLLLALACPARVWLEHRFTYFINIALRFGDHHGITGLSPWEHIGTLKAVLKSFTTGVGLANPATDAVLTALIVWLRDNLVTFVFHRLSSFGGSTWLSLTITTEETGK